MALSTSKQLYEAILLLKEDERARQQRLATALQHRGMKSSKPKEELEEDDESEGQEEEESDEPSETSDDEGQDKQQDNNPKKEDGKDKKLAGAGELVSLPQRIPETLKGSDFISKIDSIRAGASLKDEEVKSRVIGYVRSLSPEERDDLWVNLDSLARIILGGLDPAEVYTPSLLTGPKEKKKETQVKKKDREENDDPKLKSGPIVTVKSVNEGVKKHVVESPYILDNKRTVKFGHKSHIKDLHKLLQHLSRFKSCQERQSESALMTTLMMRTVRTQLNAAEKKSESQKTSDDVENKTQKNDLIVDNEA